MKSYEEFFSGKKLYGEDLSDEEVKEWVKDEREAYSNLGGNNMESYGYHSLNSLHGYSKLKGKSFNKVLCFGGGNANEILPIINKVNEIFIVEPSKKYRAKELKGKRLNYLKTSIYGDIVARDNTFDLITCFGVLHHTPKVSYVLKEFKRVLKKEGYLLIREPTVSMGDWRKTRKGITKRERGIPLDVFDEMIKKENFEVIYKHRVMHPLSRKGFFIFSKPFGNSFVVKIDSILSKIFSFNKKYHSTKFYHKLQPQSVFYVLKK